MFKVGDEVRYSSAIGRRMAKVVGIQVRPTAKRGHSIPFMTLNVYGVSGLISIPADKNSLAMFKVELV